MNILYTVAEWTAGILICLLIIIRYDLLIKGTVYGGLIIASGVGLIVVALPLLLISPLLIPVAVLVVMIIPIWIVFKN